MLRITALLLIVAMMGISCAPVAPPPPHNLSEYETMRTRNPKAYPRRTILLNNLQRVLDPEKVTAERTASLKLVLHLGASDISVRDRLSSILAEPD